MLKKRSFLRLALLWAALQLGGCEQATETEPAFVYPAQALDARYELLFNDTLVGTALFSIDVDAHGNYRIDAFAAPAGKMQREVPHEVLESSHGIITADDIRPRAFEESVLHDTDIQLASLAFDWENRRLRITGLEGDRDISLLPGTQDRLSYLLEAHRLAARGDGKRLIQVASTEASEAAHLEVVGSEQIEVPYGRIDAVSIRRVTPDSDETRQLWFAPNLLPLPLRALQLRDDNEVEMQLVDVSRRSIDLH